MPVELLSVAFCWNWNKEVTIVVIVLLGLNVLTSSYRVECAVVRKATLK